MIGTGLNGTGTEICANTAIRKVLNKTMITFRLLVSIFKIPELLNEITDVFIMINY